jgi:pyruvate dehydrogenase E1 component alpha subunit
MEWRKRDPIGMFEAKLEEMGMATASDLAAVHEQVQNEINDAIAFAEASPYPEPSALMEDVYA